MEELIRQLGDVCRGMWKYRWPAVLVAWLVAAVGVVIVIQIPDRYEASARIYVDTQSILKPLMSGLTVQPNIDQQVVMLSRTLISRPNLEKLVRMADLDLRADSKIQQEEVIESLTQRLAIASAGRDNLYTLSFRDSDPDKAKRVIQALVSIFVESSLGASRKDTDSAKVFINEQIKNYEAKLEAAEARLKEFKLRNIDLQTADGRDAAGRLSDLASQLESARLELREAENARDQAKLSLDAEKKQRDDPGVAKPVQESSIPVATPEIDARLAAQKQNLDTLLQRFTELHPDVISARHLIKDLEKQKEKQVKELQRAAMEAPAGSSSSNDSYYKELLASADVQVASLRARVAEYTARYNRAKAALKTAPQIEAEASQLNRDYAIQKKNYEDLVARREAATMSGNLEVASGVVDFRLIDPPRVSPRPVSPNRVLLLPLALAAAVAAGLFAAFAAAELRPVFHGPNELRGRVQLPLLGVVSLMMTDAEQRRERLDLIRFWIASGSLLGVFILGLSAMTFMDNRWLGR